MTEHAASPHVRRHDPRRRERILAAALDVIADCGVAGATHRKIAAAADVPLGSMTYHFTGMEQLLTEAFTSLAVGVSNDYAALLAAAETPEEAREAVVEVIVGDVWATPRKLALTYELYAFASRNPALKAIIRDWIGRSQAALERHFDRETARALDALVEGLGSLRAVEREPLERAFVRQAVDRLCG